MTQIALHFEIAPGVDPEAAARDLAEGCLALSNVEAAEGEAIAARGPSEVVLILTLATGTLTAAASTLKALKSVIVTAKDLGETLGLRKAKVEDGRKLVAPDQLTEADTKRLMSKGPT
jgi:hypothetical protein